VGDQIKYGRFWSNSDSPETDSPFVAAVKQRVQDYDLIHDPELRNGDWSVVETKDEKPVALYFDLDASGTLSDNERILPTPLPANMRMFDTQFVTPDFTIRQDDGREIPFRLMVLRESALYDKNYYWSPACILEGQATLASEPTSLLLYGDRFTGSFTTFGRCLFSLLPTGREPDGETVRTTLSSLIHHEGSFYRLRFDGDPAKGKTLRLILTKDTSPTGRAAIRLNAKEPLRTRPDTITINGAHDGSIRFNPQDAQSPLPVDEYSLNSGRILYGVETDNQWQMDFIEGPAFVVVRDGTADVDLGEPAITAHATQELERGRYSEEKTVYARGASIHFYPHIKGKAGEVYRKFSRKSDTDDQWVDVAPRVAVFDAAGKEVLSEEMGYG
jgi:hypothetical protein